MSILIVFFLNFFPCRADKNTDGSNQRKLPLGEYHMVDGEASKVTGGGAVGVPAQQL